MNETCAGMEVIAVAKKFYGMGLGAIFTLAAWGVGASLRRCRAMNRAPPKQRSRRSM
jgi:hypothetical protein